MLLQTRVKLELLANNSPWPAPISWLPKRGDRIRSLDIVAACMLGVSSAVHTGGNARAHASPRPSLHWHIFAFLLGPPSARDFSAYCPVLFLLRRACLRIFTFCTSSAPVRRAIPDWISRDFRSVCIFWHAQSQDSPATSQPVPPHSHAQHAQLRRQHSFISCKRLQPLHIIRAGTVISFMKPSS